MAEEYNGYYNWEVWNVMSWLDNEHDIYERKIKVFSDYYENKINTSKFNQGINQVGRQAHMRSDIKKKKLTKTEINQLRKEIKEQYQEYKKYRKEQGSY